MEATAKITSKGQITVPKVVREALGVGPGDRLRFVVEDGGAVLRPVPRRRASEFVGILALPDDHPAIRYVRELATRYSGQEYVQKLKEWEQQTVEEAAAEHDRQVTERWRRGS